MLDSVQITLVTARKSIQGLDKKLKKIKPGGWLLVIIIFALFLRLYFFVGLNGSSDVNYAKFAHDVLNSYFYIGNVVDALRPPSFYPIAFFYFLFGINEFSLVSYHLLTSIGSIVIIFYLGKYFFDEKTALLAALFLSFFPLNVIYATWALPDVPISFLSGLVILIFFKAKDKIKIPSFGIDLRKILFLLCGILIGFGYLHKVSGAIILLFTTSIYYTSKNLDHIHANTKHLREIYKFTKKHPEQKVYCSYYAVCCLEFYYKYEDNEPVRTYDSTIDPEQLEGSFVVLNSTFYEIKNPICFPSKDWVLFRVITGPKIGVLGTYDPKI